ncbi:MAG: transporter substrate-binding domain-containing protein [Synergistaceae bacterium]|nr:transporter substrate-binding domain-containing protein [Synergistaceae bacterium]
MYKIKKQLLICVLIVLASAGFFTFSQKGDNNHDNGNNVRIGFLSYLGSTEDEIQNGFDKFRVFLSEKNHVETNDKFLLSIMKRPRVIKFYDSIMGMLMDFRAGKIDEIILPEIVGKYVLSLGSSFGVKFTTGLLSSGISFGFRKNDTELRDNFNKIITEMEKDGTLEKLKEKYIGQTNVFSRQSITPTVFENAPTIKVAVTGDMPPIDMFAGDGKPTGFSTEILSEVGKRLGKNIQLINTESGGRSAALLSGRADVVFWYRNVQCTFEGEDPLDELFDDAPDGVILSAPYYSWQKEIIMEIEKQ